MRRWRAHALAGDSRCARLSGRSLNALCRRRSGWLPTLSTEPNSHLLQAHHPTTEVPAVARCEGLSTLITVSNVLVPTNQLLRLPELKPVGLDRLPLLPDPSQERGEAFQVD